MSLEKDNLTKDEEADEIIRRLSFPPKKRTPFDDLVKEIQEEIDQEILTELMKYAKRED